MVPRRLALLSLVAVVALLACTPRAPQAPPAPSIATVAAPAAPVPARAEPRITILYDAFGKRSDLAMDWGFSALLEIGGRRILFDTGNDADLFERNVTALGVDLTHLDFAVVSHRHGDHTDGLRYLLRVNPTVTIYAPRDEYFGGPTPPAFFQRGAPSLPPEARYFGGKPPSEVPHGTPWDGARIIQVDKPTEIAPGVHAIPTTSQVPGTMELNELSLAIDTAEGLVVICGCSHPGIEKIVAGAAAIDPKIRLIVGGMHLVTTPEPEIQAVATALHDRWNVRFVAPGHCTGEPAFAALREVFRERYLYAGLGTTLSLP